MDNFNFDVNNANAVPVMDDTWLHDYNVPERVETFVQAALSQGSQTKGNHIMFTMGSDFQYEAASEWYTIPGLYLAAARVLPGKRSTQLRENAPCTLAGRFSFRLFLFFFVAMFVCKFCLGSKRS